MRIDLVDYDPRWPDWFEREAGRIRGALGVRALRVEHAGSTSVPGLAAKQVIDVVLEVADSSDEESYAAELERAGYDLRHREPEWHQHRMFRRADPAVNLHVFSRGCQEIERMLRFRDWLRHRSSDRELYLQTKRALALEDWPSVQHYADAKAAVIERILGQAATLAGPQPDSRRESRGAPPSGSALDS